MHCCFNCPQSRVWVGPLCMPASQRPTSSALSLGGAAFQAHSREPHSFCLGQSFASFTFSSNGAAHAQVQQCPTISALSGQCSPASRYCSILLALHPLQAGEPLVCSPVGEWSSTLLYLLDQSRVEGPLVCTPWCPPVSVGSSARRGGWSLQVGQWGWMEFRPAIDVQGKWTFSSSTPGVFPQLPESSRGSPTFSVWSLSLAYGAEAVELAHSRLGKNCSKYVYIWCVLGTGQAQLPPMLPCWTRLSDLNAFYSHCYLPILQDKQCSN